jgi:hypothetical protein
VSETFSGRLLALIERDMPDYGVYLNDFARDVKTAAEKVAPPL